MDAFFRLKVLRAKWFTLFSPFQNSRISWVDGRYFRIQEKRGKIVIFENFKKRR